MKKIIALLTILCFIPSSLCGAYISPDALAVKAVRNRDGISTKVYIEDGIIYYEAVVFAEAASERYSPVLTKIKVPIPIEMLGFVRQLLQQYNRNLQSDRGWARDFFEEDFEEHYKIEDSLAKGHPLLQSRIDQAELLIDELILTTPLPSDTETMEALLARDRGVIFINDVKGQPEERIADNLYSRVRQANIPSLRVNSSFGLLAAIGARSNRFSNYLKPGEPFQWILFGGKMSACIPHQIKHTIMKEIAEGPKGTETRITLPLRAIAEPDEEKVEKLKRELPDKLAEHMKGITAKWWQIIRRRKVKAPLGNAFWSFLNWDSNQRADVPIFISGDIKLTVMRDDEELCTVNPGGSKTVIIEFYTGDPQELIVLPDNEIPRPEPVEGVVAGCS